MVVLNLVINGWPSILKWVSNLKFKNLGVLNLVINGWPSIQMLFILILVKEVLCVLNLVINGWPSIPLPKGWMLYLC